VVGGAVVRRGMVLAAALAAGFLIPAPAAAQSVPPPLADFFELASTDASVADAAAERLAPAWKDAYAAMIVDLARFFRPARAGFDASEAEAPRGIGEASEGGGPPPSGEALFRTPVRTPESQVRERLIRFLSRQTGQRFGHDLKRWRKWIWARPPDAHPEYAAFKARLYANVDPRMATFFEADAVPRIRLDEIDWGGVGVNGIPPLDQPKVLPAAGAGYLGDRNVVFGIVVNGEARAYPKRILAWHEMALDTVGGVRLAVVYCTLCGTVIPYESTAEGRTFTFGTSGLLYRSNKLMFDLETKSLWSTLEGRPVVGSLAASSLRLNYRPVVTTTWKEWRTAHPETTVLSLETGYKRDYGEGAAYRAYFSHDELMFAVPAEDKRLKRKAEVVTLFAGADAQLPVALDSAFLDRHPLHSFRAGGVAHVVLTSSGGAHRVYRTETTFVRLMGDRLIDDQGRSWQPGEEALEGPDGEQAPRVPARRTFWFAWFAQFPETVLVK